LFKLRNANDLTQALDGVVTPPQSKSDITFVHS